MNGKTAIVIGATGLVGSNLVKLLLEDKRFEKIIVFTRRSIGIIHPKLSEEIIDFNKPEEWKNLIKGDILFSALGTTLKQAGSKEAEYKVDYTYQYQFANAASINKVPAYVLISSAGANEKSAIFYSRMKGELDRDVQKLDFKSLHIIRPGLLVGKRETERKSEKASLKFLKLFNSLGILREYKPVYALDVAKLMVWYSFTEGKAIHESKELHKLLLLKNE